jgi:CheY-like chemotaxis protein
VLVVEDNDINMLLAIRMLAQLGIKADQAIDGRACLRACERATYDLVFMDLRMQNMDGLEATDSYARWGGATPSWHNSTFAPSPPTSCPATEKPV